MAGAGKARIADRDDTGQLACVTPAGRLCVTAIITGWTAGPIPVIVSDSVETTFLSASTNGRPISVTSASVAAALHTVPAGKVDCLSIYACNNTGNLRRLEITISSGTDPLIAICPPGVTVTAVCELVLAAGETVEATLDGAAAGDTHVYGKVERRDV